MKKLIIMLVLLALCMSVMMGCGGKKEDTAKPSQLAETSTAEKETSTTEAKEKSEKEKEADYLEALSSLAGQVFYEKDGMTAKIDKVESQQLHISYSMENQNPDNKKMYFYVWDYTFNNIILWKQGLRDWMLHFRDDISPDGLQGIKKGDTGRGQCWVFETAKETCLKVPDALGIPEEDFPFMTCTLFWRAKAGDGDWTYGSTTLKTSAYDPKKLNGWLDSRTSLGEFTAYDASIIEVLQPKTETSTPPSRLSTLYYL